MKKILILSLFILSSCAIKNLEPHIKFYNKKGKRVQTRQEAYYIKTVYYNGEVCCEIKE